jgi:hypothetical protein
MRTIQRSLAWKEWHEHKWKLASIAAILCGVTSLAMLEEKRDMFGLAFGLLVMCIVPLAVFVGLGAAANERSRGTLAFLQALPVPMWRVACSKLLFGVVTLVVPVVFAVALFYVWTLVFENLGVDYRTREFAVGWVTGVWFIDILVVSALIAASVFIWSAAAGMNRKDEVSAAAVALALMLGWCLLLALAGNVVERISFDEPIEKGIVVVGFSTAPGGFMPALGIAEDTKQLVLLSIVTSAVIHLVLVMLYVRTFGRVANVEIRSPRAAIRESGRPDWLAPPRRSVLTAIAWKQVRESGPIVLAGLAGVAGIVAAIVLPNLEHMDAASFGQILGASTMVLGVAVSLVVGIGVFLNDLTPQHNLFWRSRPIHPDGWFWIKFVSGWIVLLVSFSIPLLAVAFILWAEMGDKALESSNIFIVLAPLSIYTAAVATTCLVRHAVYAAILSIPMIYLGTLLVGTVLVIARIISWVERPVSGDLWQMSELQFAAGFVVSIAISTGVAWLAMRNDWGWKSRY